MARRTAARPPRSAAATTAERARRPSLRTSPRRLRRPRGTRSRRRRAAPGRRSTAPTTPSAAFTSRTRHVDRLLAGPAEPLPAVAAEDVRRIEAEADAPVAAGADLRLRRLARASGSSPSTWSCCSSRCAPDVDARFERLYGYLHDDVTRRRASVGLALELAGAAARRPPARATGSTGRPARRRAGSSLVEDARPAVPDAGRCACPDRVAMHLLGDDHADPRSCRSSPRRSPCRTGDPAALARALADGATARLRAGARPVPPGARSPPQRSRASGRPVLALDLAPARRATTPRRRSCSRALREARLRGAGLVAGPVERLAELDRGALRGARRRALAGRC